MSIRQKGRNGGKNGISPSPSKDPERDSSGLGRLRRRPSNVGDNDLCYPPHWWGDFYLPSYTISWTLMIVSHDPKPSTQTRANSPDPKGSLSRIVCGRGPVFSGFGELSVVEWFRF